MGFNLLHIKPTRKKTQRRVIVKMVSKLFGLVTLITLYPINAYAYLDPGLGSILVQSLVAGLGGILIFWGKVKETFGKIFLRKKNKAPESSDTLS